MGFGDAMMGANSGTLNQGQTNEICAERLRQGINFYDTALAYQNGTSEQYVGKALRELTNRNEYVIATKFLPLESSSKIASKQHIFTSIDQSLKNLGMDYVDLYIYHKWDASIPIYDVMDALNTIVKIGKARAIGISNCYAYQLAKANAVAEKEGFEKFVSVQGHYNLIAREEEREMAKLCKEDQITMTPYSALAGGRLAKMPGQSTKRLQEDHYAKMTYDVHSVNDQFGRAHA